MLNYSTTKVTMELRDVLASKTTTGEPFNLWDFDYPSYYKGDEKTAFEQKVIDHYLFHQIGCETIARFHHNFKTRVREIMPYYIQMYKSVEIMDKIEDPFGNVDVTETFQEQTTGKANTTESGTSSSTGSGTTSTTASGTTTTNGSGTTTTNGSGTSSSNSSDAATSSSTETANKTDTKTAGETTEHRFSNTPHGTIENLSDHLTEASVDDKEQDENIVSNGTVTTANESETTSLNESETTSRDESETTSRNESETTTQDNSETTSEASGTTSRESDSETEGTVTRTLTRKGNQGVNTYAHDMIEFRQSFINVDMMVIGALRDLFLLIY